MSAMLRQIEEILSEHHAAFGFGCRAYIIAIDDQVFEGETLSEAVSLAWAHTCKLPASPVATPEDGKSETRLGLLEAAKLLRTDGVLLPIIPGETKHQHTIRFCNAFADKLERLASHE